MVKKTTTAKKITVTGGKTAKKTVAAKATPKTAKTTKKVTKKAPAKSKKTSASKKTSKKVSSKKPTTAKAAAKKTVKSTAKPAPVPSPVRKVEELEPSDNQFTSNWMLIIIAVVLFVGGLGLWFARDADNTSVDGGTTEVQSTVPNNFQPSVRVIEN